MNDKLAYYQSPVTKYIVFTICAVVLINLLRKTLLEVSGCKTAQDNAIKAYQTYEQFNRK